MKEKPSKNIPFLLELKLIEYGIDRTKYHGGHLEGTSIVRMLQNANEIFNQYKISISKSIIEDAQINGVNDVTERYIDICTLFDTLFSLSRNTRRVINKRKTIDAKTLNKERKKRAREECYENSIENNETMMNDYDLYPRIK